MSDLLAIGELAAICRLTVKALRHYDELGLLEPARVDPKTGYRYYRRDQARTAILIGMLRSLDTPLPNVRAMIGAKGPDELESLLAVEHARLDRELARTRAALAAIEHLQSHRALVPYRIEIRLEPEHLVATIDGRVAVESHVADTDALLRSLVASLRARGIEPIDPYVCRLPNGMRDETFPVAISVGVAAPFDAFEGIRCERIGATTVATARHVGSYEALGLAHHAIHGFVHDRGLAIAGSIAEIYRNDPRETDVAALITDVMLPVRERE